MKKLIFLKPDSETVKVENASFCGCCGDEDKKVFTFLNKDETQICGDCVRQLHKLLTNIN